MKTKDKMMKTKNKGTNTRFSQIRDREENQRKIEEYWKGNKQLDDYDISKIDFSNIGYKPSKLNTLFKSLKREERSMMDELMNEIDVLENSKNNIRELKKSLRSLQLDIMRGYDDPNINIEIQIDCVMKKGNEYIRGRVYWDGEDGRGRREIHFGSISKVIDKINEYIDKGVDGFPKRKYSDKIRSLDWNGIKDNDKILFCIRRIGKDKFRYILFKTLLSRRTLGYRIRTKNMKGKVTILDKVTLSSLNPKDKYNHLDVKQVDDILKKNVEDNDTKWYQNIEEIKRKKLYK